MRDFGLVEDYFIRLHKNYGISELSYRDQKIELNEHNMSQLVFVFEDFNEEFDNLLAHCDLIYNEIEKAFSIKIRKDINDDYLVNVV